MDRFTAVGGETGLLTRSHVENEEVMLPDERDASSVRREGRELLILTAPSEPSQAPAVHPVEPEIVQAEEQNGLAVRRPTVVIER